MKLIVISPPFDSKKELDVVNKLFDNGLMYFHLRKPFIDHISQKKYINGINEEHRNKVIIHQHFNTMSTHPVKGVHFKDPHLKLLNQGDPEYQKWLNRKATNGIHVSASFHDLDQLIACKHDFDYTFISPVFESISKTFYASTFSQGALLRTVDQANQNVIALGGIEPDKIPAVEETGFYGVAVLGHIWQNTKPILNFKSIKKACQAINA